MTLLVCVFKLRNFETSHGGNATEASAWVDFISPCGHNPLLIYIKGVCHNDGHTLFAYIDQSGDDVPWCVHIYRSAWAGFTLLILDWGQCEGLNTGIGAERNLLPRLFCFQKIKRRVE